MFIKNLKLENYRNFEALEIELEAKPGIQIFLGQNAQGKTNLLESIFLLSFPRSFRASSPNDLIRFKQNHFIIEGGFSDFDLKFGYQKTPIRRTYQKNKNEVSLQEFLTTVQTVLFTPEDVEILNDSPSERRRLIDTILSQIDRDYFLDLIHFTKILKQRNALLKRIKDRKATVAELGYWDKEFAKTAAAIHLKRHELVEYFATHLAEFYRLIAGDEIAEVSLKFAFSGHSRIEKTKDYNYEDLVLELLFDDRKYETEVGHTTVGPHRDDLTLFLNGKSVSEFCSRGEKRSFMLVLKMIELEFLAVKSGRKPILLLDDVFSELDINRRTALLKLSEKYQTLITTVEKSYFKDFKGDLNLFNFDKNSVLKYN